MWSSPVSTTLVHAPDDGVDELIGETISLRIPSEIPVSLGFAVRTSEEEYLASVDTVELVIAIEGDALEHERQSRLVRSFATTGDLVVADEVGGEKGGTYELDDVVALIEPRVDLLTPLHSRKNVGILPSGEVVSFDVLQAGSESGDQILLEDLVRMRPGQEELDGGHGDPDRKSTRLNSSHP